MSVRDGREIYARRYQRYSAEFPPPTETVMQRSKLQAKARRGDHLAAQTLKQWEAEHPSTDDEN